MIDLAALVLTCAPLVAQDTARALNRVESAGNPFAIGVVGGALARQPANLPEALATVAALEAAGWNYSVGLGQINKRNFERPRWPPKLLQAGQVNYAGSEAMASRADASFRR